MNDQLQTNGHAPQKVFTLSPTADPITRVILDARRDVLADKRITRSMKAFFVEILDRSLNPNWFKERGVVTISDPALAAVFGVSVRTIFTWKKTMEDCGHLWVSKQFKSNMWPITTYHISALHEQPKQRARTDSDGTYGGGKLRGEPVNPGMGCRRPKEPALPLPGSKSGHAPEKTATLLGISGRSRKKDRVRAEVEIGSDPKPGSGESRSGDRVRPDPEIGSEPKSGSGESRSALPVPPEANSRLRETQIGDSDSSEVKGGGNPPLDLKFEGWRKSLEKLFPRELEKMKTDLAALVRKAKPEDRANWKRRLAAVEERLYGAALPEEVSPRPAVAAARSQAENPPASAEEVLEGARYLLGANKRKALTPVQRAALESVGEL